MARRGQTFPGAGPAAIARAGISMRQLTYWIDRGLFTPIDDGSARPGIGRHRELTDADVVALQVLGRLMSLRDTNAVDITAKLREIATHVQYRGAVGTFELIPGVTVDLARLIGDEDAMNKDWKAYWESLTDDERDQERRSMDEHVVQSDVSP